MSRTTTKLMYLSLLFVLISTLALAHGGRLNSSGCHTDRKTGSYHCHNRATKSLRSPWFQSPRKGPRTDRYNWHDTRVCKFRDWRITYSDRQYQLLFEGTTTCRTGYISFSLYEQELGGTTLHFIGKDRVQIWNGSFSSFLHGVMFNPRNPMIEYSIERWDQVEGLIRSEGVLTIR